MEHLNWSNYRTNRNMYCTYNVRTHCQSDFRNERMNTRYGFSFICFQTICDPIACVFKILPKNEFIQPQTRSNDKHTAIHSLITCWLRISFFLLSFFCSSNFRMLFAWFEHVDNWECALFKRAKEWEIVDCVVGNHNARHAYVMWPKIHFHFERHQTKNQVAERVRATDMDKTHHWFYQTKSRIQAKANIRLFSRSKDKNDCNK